MNKKDIFNDKKVIENNPKIDMKLIEEADKLVNSPFSQPKIPKYTLSPALGTGKQRLDNMKKIYHLGG